MTKENILKNITEIFEWLDEKEASLLLVDVLALQKWDFSLIKQIIDKNILKIINWEERPTKIYKKLKWLEKYVKKWIKELEEPTREEVERDPLEFPEFSISTRKTFDFKQNSDYLKEYNKIKELENKLKIASEMNLKWESYVDADWVIVEPVEVKFNTILTYKQPRNTNNF